MDLIPTASQTIGPFFHLCLSARKHGNPSGEPIRLFCRVLDGDRTPVNDALLEIWQADGAGEFGYFERQWTNTEGIALFETVKPGRVVGQAPHVSVLIFARGLLKQLYTRIYFAGDPANSGDAVLALVPEDRRETLMATSAATGVWNFEIRLCADCETVFFDV